MDSAEILVHSLLTEWKQGGQQNRDRLRLVKKHFPTISSETQRVIVVAMALQRKAERLSANELG